MHRLDWPSMTLVLFACCWLPCLSVRAQAPDQEFNDLAVSPTRELIALPTEQGEVHLLDYATLEPKGVLKGTRKGKAPAISCACYCPKTGVLFTGNDVGEVHQWDVGKKTSELVRKLDPEVVLDVQCSADGKWLAATTQNWLHLLDRQNNWRESKLPPYTPESIPFLIRFSDDSKWVTCTHDLNRTRLWNVQTKKLQATIETADQFGTSVRFVNESKEVLHIGNTGHLNWITIGGKSLGALETDVPGPILLMSNQPNEILIAGEWGYLRTYELKNGKLLLTGKARDLYKARPFEGFVRENGEIVLVTDRGLKVLNLKDVRGKSN